MGTSTGARARTLNQSLPRQLLSLSLGAVGFLLFAMLLLLLVVSVLGELIDIQLW